MRRFKLCVIAVLFLLSCFNAHAAELTVIVSKDCRTCSTVDMTDYLKGLFEKLVIKQLDYNTPLAKKITKEFDVKSLPAYILSKDIKEDSDFNAISNYIKEGQASIFLLPELSGMTYLLEREKLETKVDLFLSLFSSSANSILKNLKELNPSVHFLLVKDENGVFTAPNGIQELEEDSRSVCIQKYYPQIFLDYLIERTKEINSSWWNPILKKLNIDEEVIQKCGQSKEANELLDTNSSLNYELKINRGPVMLINNNEIFFITENTISQEIREYLKNN